MRPLETTRLILEPQLASHATEMFVVLGDPAIYEFENEPPRSLGWLRDRFTKLESRRSGDGRQHWLNWVVRLRGAGLIGYVQATVLPDARAMIAYELNSAHWGHGLGHEAVAAMIDELVAKYEVHTVAAVFKGRNHRSRRLLQRLGMVPGTPEQCAAFEAEPDEDLMLRDVGGRTGAGARSTPEV